MSCVDRGDVDPIAWEYLTIPVEVSVDHPMMGSHLALNYAGLRRAGDEGWELVVIRTNEMILKRRKRVDPAP